MKLRDYLLESYQDPNTKLAKKQVIEFEKYLNDKGIKNFDRLGDIEQDKIVKQYVRYDTEDKGERSTLWYNLNDHYGIDDSQIMRYYQDKKSRTTKREL